MEVRPFREDLLKLPGGEGGKAYALLNELSGLVDAQKHVMRETHGHLQRRYEKPELAAQDRAKLADAERDLAEAARHLYAKMAAELENAPIGDVLDNLAKARGVARARGPARSREQEKEALQREQDALTDLVATRKTLQKTITDHPEAFGDGDDADEREDAADRGPAQEDRRVPRRGEGGGRIARASCRTRQKQVAETARAQGEHPAPELGAEQERIGARSASSSPQHPRAFKGSEPQADAARKAADESAEALRSGRGRAPPGGGSAATRWRRCATARPAPPEKRGLSQAYRLREMIEDQARDMGGAARGRRRRRGGAGGCAEDARETTRELGRTARGDARGRGVRAAPAPGTVAAGAGGPRARARRARRVRRAPDERREAAAKAAGGLDRLARAFDDSAPRERRARRGPPTRWARAGRISATRCAASSSSRCARTPATRTRTASGARKRAPSCAACSSASTARRSAPRTC